MSKKINLSALRKEIDKIDEAIIKLVNRRGVASSKIGQIKKGKDLPVYSPDRESQVLRSVAKRNKGPVDDSALKAIYSEVMSACLSLEKPLVIAFLGPELTFSHQIAIKKFGSSVDYIPCDSIPNVFREVEKGNADYGVVPVENSTEGAVTHTMDMFVDSKLVICSEAYLRIRHCLMSRSSSLKAVKKVYSHPNVFGQCRLWLEKNLSQAKLKESSSTTRAAELALKAQGSACIASEMAAKRYRLKVLARSIEDSAQNVTRFLVIGNNRSAASGADKTSLMFSVKDKPGVLHDMLNSFKKGNINLTRIESRPSKQEAWKYYFFVDMEGHCNDAKVKKAMKELNAKSHFVKVLGSYPRG